MPFIEQREYHSCGTLIVRGLFSQSMSLNNFHLFVTVLYEQFVQQVDFTCKISKIYIVENACKRKWTSI